MHRKFPIILLLFSVTVSNADAADTPELVSGLPLQPLFVSGEEGYGRYRIPSLIVTSQKTVLAFCEGRRKPSGLTGDIDLVLRRSTDGGRIWQPAHVVADDGPNTLGNPCAVIDRQGGTIWLAFTRSLGEDLEDQITAGTSKGTTTVWITSSNDDGITWAKPVEITSTAKRPEWTWYGTGPGVGLQLKSGRLFIPSYHAHRDGAVYRCHSLFSDDHGKTWKLGGVLGDHTSEPQCVERDDGSLFINARGTNNQGYRTIGSSRDGGETWTNVELDKRLTEPACQASLIRLPAEGTAGKSRWLFSNPPGTKRKGLTLRLSPDEGETWPTSRVLEPGATEYSCLTILPDGAIGLLYERNPGPTYKPHVTFVRIPMTWLK